MTVSLTAAPTPISFIPEEFPQYEVLISSKDPSSPLDENKSSIYLKLVVTLLKEQNRLKTCTTNFLGAPSPRAEAQELLKNAQNAVKEALSAIAKTHPKLKIKLNKAPSSRPSHSPLSESATPSLAHYLLPLHKKTSPKIERIASL